VLRNANHYTRGNLGMPGEPPEGEPVGPVLKPDSPDFTGVEAFVAGAAERAFDSAAACPAAADFLTTERCCLKLQMISSKV